MSYPDVVITSIMTYVSEAFRAIEAVKKHDNNMEGLFSED